MTNYYFTFAVSSEYKNNYAIVRAYNADEACFTMNLLFPRLWASVYNEKKGNELVEKYALTLLGEYES